jgi:DNA-binding NtrC family response regulator
MRDNQPVKRLSEAAIGELQSYHWPGNVRELNNVLERCACLIASSTIDDSQLPLGATQVKVGQSDVSLNSFNDQAVAHNTTREKRMEAVDRDYLDKLLKRHKGNVSRAAHEARLTRQGLHKALLRLGLNAQDYRQA